MFALLGSTWWEWESETAGCPRTTTPATQTNSIRWELNFTKVRQLWKPCYRAIPKCYRWDLWTKTIATTALLKNKTPNIILMPEACECGNTPNSVDLLFLLRGKSWLKLLCSRSHKKRHRYEAWQSWNNEFGYFLTKMDWWVLIECSKHLVLAIFYCYMKSWETFCSAATTTTLPSATLILPRTTMKTSATLHQPGLMKIFNV